MGVRTGLLGSKLELQSLNPHFALLCRFMGILRLIKYSGLIVEYNDGKDSKLFDFCEPMYVVSPVP